MSDGQRIDGDKGEWMALTDEYWQDVLSDTGSLGVSYLDSDTSDTPRLYGTMHNGEVKGVAVADTPQADVLRQWRMATERNKTPSYDTQTYAEAMQSINWEMSKHMAELAQRVRELEQWRAELTADS